MSKCCCNNSTRGCNCSWYSSTQAQIVRQIPPIIYPLSVTNNTVTAAFFVNNNITVLSNSIIPVTISNIIGNDITTSGNGAIVNQGNYRVKYDISATRSVIGDVIAGLSLNNVIMSDLTHNSTVNVIDNYVNVSGSGILTINNSNSTIRLVNQSSNSITIKNLNLVIEKIN